MNKCWNLINFKSLMLIFFKIFLFINELNHFFKSNIAGSFDSQTISPLL